MLRMKLKEQGPKLHYTHPICFEAGKPMEFVVCGSNLLQPNLRYANIVFRLHCDSVVSL